MRTYQTNTLNQIILGMIIALEEREKHHALMGDEDISKMYREQIKTVQRQGKVEKKFKDGSWTSDMFAKVYHEMRLDPNDYFEVYEIFFSL